VRLNQYLAAAGITSRRGADTLIADGRVTVNGKQCTDFHYRPGPTDHVKVDGKSVHHQTPVYLAMNKPAGFVCTRNDPDASDTIFDLLPPKFSSLFYVGRLDVSSEGLLLLTNDGDFAHRLAHPRFHVEKEYDVKLDKPASNELGSRLIRGVMLDGKLATATRVRQSSPTRLRVVLRQGINRQLRRMLEHFGFRAKRLRRVRVGNLNLDDLSLGKWRRLEPHEVRDLSTKAMPTAKKPAK
jgi:pseudouridine synthase